MGQKSCTKALRPWDDWVFAVILSSMFSAVVNQAPINMCILAEKQSQNSRFGCCKPSLVKLYLFANEKMSIRFDIFSFAFDILSLSFVIPEGPAFALRARNERMPLSSRSSRFTAAGMSNENKVGILKRNILRVKFANQI